MNAKHRIIRTNKQRVAFTNTSPIPDDEIRAAVKWLMHETNLDGTVIHFKKAGPRRRSYGRAYSMIPSVANMNGLKRDEWDYLVVVTDGRGDNWMRTLAHEAKHVEQFRNKSRVAERPAHIFGQWAADNWKR